MTTVTVDKLGPCKRRINVEISSEKINAAIEEIYRDLEKTAKIPGFRTGKVPRKVLVSRFSKDVLEEAKSKLITDTYQSSIKDNKLHPVHVPKIENVAFDASQTLSYSAEFEIEPEFELKPYDGIKVKVDKIKVKDDEIDDQVQRLRESQATLEAVEDDRSAVMGDFVVIDFKMLAEDGETVLEEGRSKLISLQKNDTYFQEVVEALVGMKKGDATTVESLLPDDFPKKEFSGTIATIDVTLLEIKEKILPDLTDDFAKSVGNFETIEDLRKEITHLLEGQKKNIQRNEGKDQISEYLLDKHSFDLPETVVESEFQSEFRTALREMRQAPEDKELDKIKEKIRSDSRKKIALSYILAEIASKENIRVDKTEVEQAINYTARSWNVSPDKLRDHLTDTGGIYGMQEQILQDKVLDFLYDKARVTEK